VLSIGKLGQGQADYYLDSVARGVEDYYTGAGEAPGQWAGCGCEDLGLSGVVDPRALRRVLSGQDPWSGAGVAAAGGRVGSVPGYDFTFSAPKSVSLLFALDGPEVSSAVRDAHEASVGGGVGLSGAACGGRARP
jgi:conjugative relaxase-like TrwC/TraI family protein